jgi:hypothetical protein
MDEHILDDSADYETLPEPASPEVDVKELVQALEEPFHDDMQRDGSVPHSFISTSSIGHASTPSRSPSIQASGSEESPPSASTGVAVGEDRGEAKEYCETPERSTGGLDAARAVAAVDAVDVARLEPVEEGHTMEMLVDQTAAVDTSPKTPMNDQELSIGHIPANKLTELPIEPQDFPPQTGEKSSSNPMVTSEGLSETADNNEPQGALGISRSSTADDSSKCGSSADVSGSPEHTSTAGVPNGSELVSSGESVTVVPSLEPVEGTARTDVESPAAAINVIGETLDHPQSSTGSVSKHEDSQSASDAVPAVSAKSAVASGDLVEVAQEASETLRFDGGAETPMRSEEIDSVYMIKWIDLATVPRPIVLQTHNGPCPLLAIANVLLQRGAIEIPAGSNTISSTELVSIVANFLMYYAQKKEIAAELRADHEQNIADALQNMDKLLTGLDVNVRFEKVTDFEFTSECLIFDLLDIRLYHGWLVDPQSEADLRVIMPRSYNQLTELILAGSEDDADSHQKTDAFHAQAFLEDTASQLTYHGIAELISTIPEEEIAVFFRNNHFSVIHRHRDELFLLITDQGYRDQPNIVWETLNNVEGDSHLVDAQFHTVPPAASADATAHAPSGCVAGDESRSHVTARRQADLVTATSPPSPEHQVDHDYAMALSLEEQEFAQPTGTPVTSGDYDMARRLQEEEEAANKQELSAGAGGGVSSPEQGSGGGSTTRSSARSSPTRRGDAVEAHQRSNSGAERAENKCTVL